MGDACHGAHPTDVVRNATDLQLDGTVATRKDVYFAFDLSAYPAASTVTAATLYLKPTTGPTLQYTASMFKIADADETWDETTMKCSNKKAASGGALDAGIVVPTGTAEIATTLGANAISRLDARMGTTSVTFLLTAPTGSSTTFESKDEGTADSSGPRLELTFTIP